jgi:hypothetical protein
MKRIIGFALFWVAAGMVINMLLDSLFIQILIIILLILVGYKLYCCK